MNSRPALRNLAARARGRRDRAARCGRAVAAAAALGGVLAAAACSGSAAAVQPASNPSPTADPVHPVGSLQYHYMTDLPDGTTAARYGYNLADVGPYQSVIDALPAGVRALVWIGDYKHSSCSFEKSDADVRAAVAPLANDPKVAGFYLEDEADWALPADGGYCPDVVSQVTQRSALVHQLAPSKFTYQVVAQPSNYAKFAHATDVMGATGFPCPAGQQSCDWSMIPKRIAALDAAHVPHYWAVLDAFGAKQWRWPTPAELTRMISQWQHSRWEGEQTFAWTWDGSVLADNPGILDLLGSLNTGRTQVPSG